MGRSIASIVRAGVAAAALAGWGSTAGAAEPPPVEHFTREAEVSAVAISPSGHRLAVLTAGPSGRQRLAVMDLDPVGNPRVVADYAHADVSRVVWVTDERLVYQAAELGYWVRPDGAGTFAVNHDGSDRRELIGAIGFVVEGRSAASRRLPFDWQLGGPANDGSADIFVWKALRSSTGEVLGSDLARLDTLTGVSRSLMRGVPAGAHSFWFAGSNELRVVASWQDGRERVHWRPPAAEGWQELVNFDRYRDAGFVPLVLDSDGTMLVRTRQFSDTVAIHRYDLAARRLDPAPVVAVKGFDLHPTLQRQAGSRELLGLHLRADRPLSVWFEPSMQALQRALDGALPAGRSNRIHCGRCVGGRFYVVQSTSDRQPGEYFLFDRERGALSRIAAARPWIDEARQGRRRLHRVAMRDGLTIPVITTDPPGARADQPLPAVVLVHGGPWVRGTDLDWDAVAQLLASRGWRVLQPEFRGSEGYGQALFRAGWKQWGRAMQTDLADTVAWAAGKGAVDASRICVAGASYGGYAALMAPIATPGVFRCAVSFAGVTDLEQMYSIHWSDISEAARRYSLPVLMGSPKDDADLLAAASPQRRVAEIKIPVLLAHGSADLRVPVDHARRFVNQATEAGVAVEAVIYDDEGHGFYTSQNALDFHRRMVTFLSRSLGAPPAAR